jgi:hypothetical protein
MMAWAGRRLRLAVRMVIRSRLRLAVRTATRAVTMAHHEQVYAWECLLLTSGAAPLAAAGPLRWVPSLDGDRLACRPGPARNGTVTRDSEATRGARRAAARLRPASGT